MAILLSTSLYITLPWLYFTLLDSKSLYLCSTYHVSTSLYLTLHNSNTIPFLYFALLDSTPLYHGSTSLYIALYHGSKSHYIPPPGSSVYFTLYQSTMALLDSTRFYINLPWLYFPLLDSTSLYHGSTSFYLILHNSSMTLLHSTSFYITLPSLYLTLLDCT